MKRITLLALLVVGALSLACGSKGREDPILRLSAAESLTEGKRLLAGEKYRQARPYLQHAFEVEPNSATGREALLLVADSLYQEGGDTNLIQAEAKYRDFQNRFPTSDRAAYVQAQIAASLAKRIERPDRDQGTTHKALEAYQDLSRLYPTSPLATDAQSELERVRVNLAEHEYLVGRFYLRFGLPKAAAARFEGLLADYPDYGAQDRVLFDLAAAYRRLKRADDAQATAQRLRKEYPQSTWIKKLPKEAR